MVVVRRKTEVAAGRNQSLTEQITKEEKQERLQKEVLSIDCKVANSFERRHPFQRNVLDKEPTLPFPYLSFTDPAPREHVHRTTNPHFDR
jgi:hypothetical protein